jgi:hypothetical protein
MKTYKRMHTTSLTKIHAHTQSGFALLLSIIISSVVLAIGVSLLHVSISQINLASTARESEIAFQAAHAGVDCLWYWRYASATELPFIQSTNPAPTFSCFSKSPYTKAYLRENVTGGFIDTYSYRFSWGSGLTGDRCSEIDMYIMQPAGAATISKNFVNVNKGIGNGGQKNCPAGNLCTIIVSRGYNRVCSDINSSIFTIQRELTVEF